MMHRLKKHSVYYHASYTCWNGERHPHKPLNVEVEKNGVHLQIIMYGELGHKEIFFWSLFIACLSTILSERPYLRLHSPIIALF